MSLRCWSMRIAIAAAASVAAPLTLAAASCDSPDPCVARACRLDADIARAKAQANTKALARLERDIDLREAQLKKVEATGNAAKTKKAQRNLESARKSYATIEKAPL